jgi:hypothetical protein
MDSESLVFSLIFIVAVWALEPKSLGCNTNSPTR